MYYNREILYFCQIFVKEGHKNKYFCYDCTLRTLKGKKILMHNPLYNIPSDY